MKSAQVVTGTLTDERNIVLDEALPLKKGKVRLILEPMETEEQSHPKKGLRPYHEVIREIRANQRARGYVPPTKEEVDAYLREERDSWGD